MNTTNEALLAAQGLHKAFGRTEALRGASLAVAAGETVAVTGRSGSGKSTLLLCLAGVLRPEAGEVTYGGRPLDALSEAERTRLRRRELRAGAPVRSAGARAQRRGQRRAAAAAGAARPGRVPTHGARLARAARRARPRGGAARRAVRRRGAAGGRRPRRWSTGPKVVFADEPTGALDTVSGEQVLDALLSAARDAGASVVLVTHDNRVAAHADREVVVSDGRIEGAESFAVTR